MDRTRKVSASVRAIDRSVMDDTQKRLDSLTKPLGSLGRLESLAKNITGITGKSNPVLKNKAIFTFAADHGVTDEGISAYPKAVTAQMVYNFVNGGAGINVLARHAGARVVVADLGVAEDLKASANLVIKKIGYGTKNMAKGPAMSREEALDALAAGIEIFDTEFKKGVDIACLGEMGIGNTTPSSAITAVFTGKSVSAITGKGTGIGDKALLKKIAVIEEAIRINRPDKSDPIDVLSKVGGFEIAGLAGVILAAASKRVPVVIDGFISAAAALIAYKLQPIAKDYMIASHSSVEKGHRIILDELGIEPIIDLNLRLGEGTGAAVVLPIIEAAVKILSEMATFKSAKVSEKNA